MGGVYSFAFCRIVIICHWFLLQSVFLYKFGSVEEIDGGEYF